MHLNLNLFKRCLNVVKSLNVEKFDLKKFGKSFKNNFTNIFLNKLKLKVKLNEFHEKVIQNSTKQTKRSTMGNNYYKDEFSPYKIFTNKQTGPP